MASSQVPQGVDAIRKSVVVDRPVAEAFALFAERMESWWPLATHSIFGARSRTIEFERRAGGEVREVSVDGEHSSWARVLVWEPPNRFVVSWYPGHDPADATEVEVRFTASGGGTRVDLEHRGWERTPNAAKARASYDGGWTAVFAGYVAAAGGAR